MPVEVPSGWSHSTLESVCDILDRKRVPLNSTQRREIPGDIPYWGANGIVDYINDFIFDEPLLLMAEDGGYFDEAHSRPICHLVNGKSWVNNHAHVMRVRTGNLREFVYYWFVHRDITRFINSGTRSKLNQADLRTLPIFLPPLPEQRKIAAILSSVDEAIAATEAVIAQTRRVKEGLLQDLLTRGIGRGGRPHTRFKQTEIGEIPESWEVVSLQNLIQTGRPICYGILKPGKNVAGGVPVVKVKNIKGGVIHDANLLLTDPKIDAAYQRSKLLPGDILVSIRGTTGRVAIVPPSLKNANITQDTARISIDEGKTTNLFVYYALQSRRLQRYITLHTIGQAVKGINIAEVRKIPVALPPLSEQKRLVEMISSTQELVWREADKLAALSQTKAGLLQDLLTGKVRVSV